MDWGVDWKALLESLTSLWAWIEISWVVIGILSLGIGTFYWNINHLRKDILRLQAENADLLDRNKKATHSQKTLRTRSARPAAT